jgi:hypothetical protein
MKKLLPLLLAVSALLTWGQTSHERRYELRPDPNLPLEIELGSGDYQIVPSASDSIAVVYDEGTADTLRNVKVQIDSGHGQNHLKIAGLKSNFHAVIEVPRKTDLRVRMSAGGLTIGDVEGNKDIEVMAGNLELNSLHPPGLCGGGFLSPHRRCLCSFTQDCKEQAVAIIQDRRPGQISFARACGSG